VQVSPVVVTHAVLGLAAATLGAGVAHADPDDVIARPLVLAPGAVEARVTAEINVQPRDIAHPMSLAPDVWYGLSPRWTIGLIHSDPSVDQIATTASFCVRESAISPCDRLYRGSGLDVRFDALAGQLALAPRLRVLIRDIDPFKPAITLGALARWVHGRFSIAADPYLRLPLANHALGNRAALVVPLWLAVQPAARWAIALRTGYDGDLAVLRDGGHGPLTLGVTSRVTDEVDLGLEAGWGSLLGPQHDAKHATILISAGWRN
jgi:hypothetical protein